VVTEYQDDRKMTLRTIDRKFNLSKQRDPLNFLLPHIESRHIPAMPLIGFPHGYPRRVRFTLDFARRANVLAAAKRLVRQALRWYQ